MEQRVKSFTFIKLTSLVILIALVVVWDGVLPGRSRGPEGTLSKWVERHDGRVMNKWHHYLEIYERHFSRFRNTDVTILEIGVAAGGSLQMWRDYFGPKARIIGVDIDPKCKALAKEPQIEIYIGDQADRTFLKKLVKDVPKIDIVIDDGGHTMVQQKTSFEELLPNVSENGVYLVEDLHTSYWEDYGGGYRSPESFIEMSKDYIDQLNAWHSKDKSLSPSWFSKSVYSMHYYDSVLVIEKRPFKEPYSFFKGEVTLY
ncbi:hypothetical protein BVY02_01255 [bacterium J17]|nr:hypothetical protein BVY02_01255 [bacterium J17]